ncbi:hypothetical protein [Burkholderia ubonensis]|uniref:hypothetical protein n=1 Tax=Burkholderia ubonensis TaxID=101571 RepID=UPI0007536E05|nr:hypothetical protein [Burkholderia ubonensis]KVP16966.1 hypothetical protein WJ84_01455 [Burkholderia ubonensis]
MDTASRSLAAFKKYLEREPSTTEDFAKGFTFACGFSAGQADLKPEIEALVKLLDGALTCAPALLNMPLGKQLQDVIKRHRERGAVSTQS